MDGPPVALTFLSGKCRGAQVCILQTTPACLFYEACLAFRIALDSSCMSDST